MGITRDFANIIRSNGDIVISGDLDVNGTQTTINTTTFVVEDKNIELGANATSNSQNDGAGISILLPDASPDEFATLTYGSTADAWSFNKKVGIGTDSPSTATNVLLTVGNTNLEYAGLSLLGGSFAEEWRLYSSFNLNDDAIFGIFRPTSNDYKFIIHENGNVGIGTTNPQDRLHVTLDSATTNAEVEVMRVEATSSGTPVDGFGPFIDFRGDRQAGNPDSYGRIGFESDGMTPTTVDGAFIIQPAEDGVYTERMRVSSSGEVGIGTDSPDARLAIHNSSLTSTAFDGTGGIRVHRPNAFGQYGWFEYGYNSDTTFIGSKYSGGTAASYGQIWFAQDSNGGSRQYPLVINGSGNVGIGTSNPGTKLDIVTSTASTEGAARIQYSGANNYEILRLEAPTDNDSVLSFKSGASYYWGMGVDFSDSGKFKIARDNLLTVNTAVTIDSSNNVGIGTDSPSTPLTLKHSATTDETGGFRIIDSNNSVRANFYYDGVQAFVIHGASDPAGTDPATLQFATGGVTPTPRMSILKNGNVGIGTTNQIGEKLTVDGSVQVLGNNDPNYSAKLISGYDSTHGLRITTRLNDVTESEVLGVFAESGGASPRLVLNPTNGWKVGIGTTSPSRELDVRGSVRFSVNTSTHETFTFTTQGVDEAKQIMKNASSVDTIILNTNGNTYFNGGNVGIGTDSPGVELDVKRTTNNYPLRIQSVGGEGRTIVFADVQTTPVKYNWIAGAQYNIENGFEITPSTAVGGYTFGSPAVAILNTGNVGIGTINPAVKLDVTANAASRIATFWDGGSNGNAMSNGAAVLGISRISDGQTSLNGPIFEVGRDNSTSTSYNIDQTLFSVHSDKIIAGNNIQFTAGNGIDFSALTSPATSGTATGNVLNDYEEGTWTASVSAGAISGTNLRFQGSYTKVGRQVFISLFIDSTTGASDIQISSYVQFSGVPFNIAKKGTGTVTTEDIDVYARQGFAELGSTFLTISAAGSSSGTSSLSIGIVGTTA